MFFIVIATIKLKIKPIIKKSKSKSKLKKLNIYIRIFGYLIYFIVLVFALSILYFFGILIYFSLN